MFIYVCVIRTRQYAVMVAYTSIVNSLIEITFTEILMSLIMMLGTSSVHSE